jgi:meiotically up-regulated gene 157 (Mug157) protein
MKPTLQPKVTPAAALNRRSFLQTTALATAGLMLAPASHSAEASFPVVRIRESQRKFKSAAVERTIQRVRSSVTNPELGWMFENCFPNTLDTTVEFVISQGRPDTYVITGDIDAMWLRDSAAQVWPYLPLMRSEPALQQLIAGVINRQTACILKDPYANAFYKDANKLSEWRADRTEMKPGVHERKWEIDSLCYPVRLAHGYWKASGDALPFDQSWREAIALILQTFREQQRKEGRGPYCFQRRTEVETDTLAGNGYGRPGKPVGLICSMFRPSDDATVFPYLVPSNFFAVISLRQAAEMVEQIHHDSETASRCRCLADEVERALSQYAVVNHEKFGRIYAYEVDGYGNAYCIDDGNVPSLLSLPYLKAVTAHDEVYLNTRRFVLSDSDPYFSQGKAGSGPGGPHAGEGKIWPLGLIVQGITSTDKAEIRSCLEMLRVTHAGTGFMHESFDKDDPRKFTRSWFAWANTMFGEFILKMFTERPQLLS